MPSAKLRGFYGRGDAGSPRISSNTGFHMQLERNETLAGIGSRLFKMAYSLASGLAIPNTAP